MTTEIEFTHMINNINGWVKTRLEPSMFDRVEYLGKCSLNGDLFAGYTSHGKIGIFKGHLNSGKY